MTSCNDDLAKLLQTWRPEAVPGADFNRNVWRRIELAETRNGAPLGLLFGWIQMLAWPRIALSAAAIALFGGIVLGDLQARNTQEEQYLLSLNPYHASSAYPSLR